MSEFPSSFDRMKINWKLFFSFSLLQMKSSLRQKSEWKTLSLFSHDLFCERIKASKRNFPLQAFLKSSDSDKLARKMQRENCNLVNVYGFKVIISIKVYKAWNLNLFHWRCCLKNWSEGGSFERKWWHARYSFLERTSKLFWCNFEWVLRNPIVVPNLYDFESSVQTKNKFYK